MNNNSSVNNPDDNGDDGDVEIAVPDVFKLLVRHVVKTFYSKEAYLVVDLIIHRPMIKEDKLVEMLHFDRKVLRTALNDLRKESLIRVKLKVENDNEGKTTRQNSYSIAYTNFLHVVKYKLDQMRVRIDAQERAAIRRTSFQCPNCTKVFSDLEFGHLLDPTSGRLLCTFCRSEVTEVTGGDGDQLDARQLMTMFNTQLASLFELVRECEAAKQEMLDSPLQRDQSALAREAFLRNNSIVVKMSNSAPVSTEVRVSVLPAGHKAEAAPTKQPREQPVWMTTSVAAQQNPTRNPTQDDVEALFGVKLDTEDFGGPVRTNEDDLFGVKAEPAPWLSEPSPTNGSKQSSTDDASEMVLRTLLDHERLEAASNASDDFVEVKDEKMESTEQPSVTTDTAMVSIQGQLFPYSDVTDEMIRKMTESERQEYIRIGSELYSDLYD